MRIVFFFFSSRRRHTRLQGDWSSDVCSSDLGGYQVEAGTGVLQLLANAGGLTELAHKDRIFVLRRGPHPGPLRVSLSVLPPPRNRAGPVPAPKRGGLAGEEPGPPTPGLPNPRGGRDD